MAKSTYYYWVKKLNRPDKYEKVKKEILSIGKESRYTYGYRRVTFLLKKAGFKINHKTVRKLMSRLGVTCKVRAKKYKSYKGTIGKIAPNSLNRKFEANRPNKKWVTDVTQFQIKDKKLYLSPILDLYNGEIITYTLFERPTFKMVEEMIESAVSSKSKERSLTIHSDQGWHYQMSRYQKILKQNNITQSMSRKGNCLDNAAMESFFGILKSEFFYNHEFSSIEKFKCEISNYIHWYNNKRIKMKLKGLSPVEYRKQSI